MTACIVTDHALVRWLERVRGVPMEEIRAAIAADISRGVIAGETIALGKVGFKVKRDGVVYFIRDGHVVTCLVPGE